MTWRTGVAGAGDIPQLLELYRVLVGTGKLGDATSMAAVMRHPGTAIHVARRDQQILSMATLHLLPNVTQSGRPYALVENVVTRTKLQGQGWGKRVMQSVITAAWDADAYKIMLMTGRAAEARGFYESLGFSADEKWGMSLRRVPIRQAGSGQSG